MGERAYIVTQSVKKLKKEEKEWALSQQGFKQVSDDTPVDITKLPEDDKDLYYKDEPMPKKTAPTSDCNLFSEIRSLSNIDPQQTGGTGTKCWTLEKRKEIGRIPITRHVLLEKWQLQKMEKLWM